MALHREPGAGEELRAARGAQHDVDLLGRPVLGRPQRARVHRVPELRSTQMQHTVAVVESGGQKVDYGLGLARFTIPGCGTAWDNGGAV
ncbi:hypothetical protein [Actinomadura sp. 6N118]|uniref:hypothetical protein n=1 Tax=Actinomadura sp. 6N118 TaxID=3375151 RepID=UPI0037909683